MRIEVVDEDPRAFVVIERCGRFIPVIWHETTQEAKRSNGIMEIRIDGMEQTMREVMQCWQCVHGRCFEDRDVGIDPEWTCALMDDDPSLEDRLPDKAGETVPCPLFEENDWREQLAEDEEWHRKTAHALLDEMMDRADSGIPLYEDDDPYVDIEEGPE